MNELLPYEEQLTQQWQYLPLPDEDMAWADMKRRLEEKDDDGIVPVWLRGCGLWAVVGVILLGMAWVIFHPERWGSKNKENTIDASQEKSTGTNKMNKTDSIYLTGSAKDTAIDRSDNKNFITDSTRKNSLIQKANTKNQYKPVNDDSTVVTQTNPLTAKRKPGNKQLNPAKDAGKGKNTKDEKLPGSGKVNIIVQPSLVKNDSNATAQLQDKPVLLTIDTVTDAKVPASDSATRKGVDSVTKKADENVSKSDLPKKDSTKSKAISFSAGLGMHQLIPIAGQKSTPYNKEGRKGSLADYIPSLFGRMYIGKKWFVQLEFRYGAPQYSKELLYQQNSKLDSIGPVRFTTTTSSKLKKTFYHQIPLSVNYFLLPRWSVGSGIVWNKFVSAVSQQEVNRRYTATLVDSLISSGIVRDKGDSLFRKSYFQLLFETQYHWKRLSIGARYSFGLQPFLKFTLPGGTSQQERNQAVQVFARYELWRAKR